MTYRLQTAMLIVAFYLAISAGDSYGYRSTMSSEEYKYFAAIDPSILIAWCIAALSYVRASRVEDPYEYTSRRAGLTRRFFGFVIDFHVCFVLVVTPLVLLALSIEACQADEFNWVVERTFRRGSDSVILVAFFLSQIAMLAAISAPLAARRRSVGGVVMGYGLRTDSRMSLPKACRRTIAGFITLCLGWISVPIAASRDDRRLWHDRSYEVYPLEVRVSA